MKNPHLLEVLETVKKRNQGEPEFIQAVTEVFDKKEFTDHEHFMGYLAELQNQGFRFQ